MKTIIAGSRGIGSIIYIVAAVRDAAKAGIVPTEVVSGCARGVDTLGERWAADHRIPIARFPADWDKYGKSAGYKRNVQMAEYAEALIAIWDGKSRGTEHMINIANRKGLQVYVHEVKT